MYTGLTTGQAQQVQLQVLDALSSYGPLCPSVTDKETEAQSSGVRLARRHERRNSQLPASVDPLCLSGLQPDSPLPKPGLPYLHTPALQEAASASTGLEESLSDFRVEAKGEQDGPCKTAFVDTSTGEHRERAQAPGGRPRGSRSPLSPEVGRKPGFQSQAGEASPRVHPLPGTPGGSEQGTAGLSRSSLLISSQVTHRVAWRASGGSPSSHLPWLVPTLLLAGP